MKLILICFFLIGCNQYGGNNHNSSMRYCNDICGVNNTIAFKANADCSGACAECFCGGDYVTR